MMYKLTNILRGRPWLLLLTLFAWLLPQQAAASYEDEPANYSVSLGGSNIVYIQAPVYDQNGADTWVYDGNLKVSVEGGATTDILHWSTEVPTIVRGWTVPSVPLPTVSSTLR